MSSSLKSEYKNRVMYEAAEEGSSGIVKRANNVRFWQRYFQRNDGLPVFLKGKNDIQMYRFYMPASVICIAGSLGLFMYMALGKMKRPKKE